MSIPYIWLAAGVAGRLHLKQGAMNGIDENRVRKWNRTGLCCDYIFRRNRRGWLVLNWGSAPADFFGSGKACCAGL